MDLKTDLSNFLHKSLEKHDEKKHRSIRYACRNFCEQTDRIIKIGNELKVLEDTFNKAEEANEKIKDLQEEFLQKSEALYERIYAGVASLNKLLQITAEKYFHEFHFGSVSKSIKSMESKFPGILEDLSIIGKTIKTRSDFVIHTNKLKGRDWSTFGSPFGDIRIIYMDGVGTGELQDLTNELGFGIKITTPFKCSACVVPPHHISIVQSWLNYTDFILEKVVHETK